MAFQELRFEVEDGVLTVTLDRPAKLNALTRTMLRELLEAFEQADADDAIRVVIVTGAGRAFCAGADLSAGARTFDAQAKADQIADIKEALKTPGHAIAVVPLRPLLAQGGVLERLRAEGFTVTTPGEEEIRAENYSGPNVAATKF